MEFSQWDNNITLAVSTQQPLRDSTTVLCLFGKMPNSPAWQRMGPRADIKGMAPSPEIQKEASGTSVSSLCHSWSSLVNTKMIDDDSLQQWEGCKSKEPEGQDLCLGTYQNAEAWKFKNTQKNYITILWHTTWVVKTFFSPPIYCTMNHRFFFFFPKPCSI